MSIEVIMNAGSGNNSKGAAQQRLTEIFDSAGVEARITIARSGAELREHAARAARGTSRTVVAGGGDGTIRTVALALAGTDKLLGVLPLGTFNYFAKDLNIPPDLDGAARNIIEGKPVARAAGTVNNRLFLNNSSLGLYPSLLREREKAYRRWGRSEWGAYVSVVLGLIRFRSALRVHLEIDGTRFSYRTPLVYLGANEYQMRSLELPGQSCPASDSLALYLVRATGRLSLFRMALRIIVRRLHGERDLHVLCARELRVETRRRRLRVASDGEVEWMQTPLHFQLVPEALRVLVPQVA